MYRNTWISASQGPLLDPNASTKLKVFELKISSIDCEARYLVYYPLVLYTAWILRRQDRTRRFNVPDQEH